MVRCEDFYKKWQAAGNFCEKHEDTAKRIDAYLDLLPLVSENTAKSEVLSDGSETMGAIITERASRPLISIEDPNKRLEAIQQVVKRAEAKKTNGKSPQVTTKEVEDIVRKIVPPKSRKQIDKTDKAKALLEDAFNNVAETPDAIDKAISQIDELSAFLQDAKNRLNQRKEVVQHAISCETEEKDKDPNAGQDQGQTNIVSAEA